MQPKAAGYQALLGGLMGGGRQAGAEHALSLAACHSEGTDFVAGLFANGWIHVWQVRRGEAPFLTKVQCANQEVTAAAVIHLRIQDGNGRLREGGNGDPCVVVAGTFDGRTDVRMWNLNEVIRSAGGMWNTADPNAGLVFRTVAVEDLPQVGIQTLSPSESVTLSSCSRDSVRRTLLRRVSAN